MDWDKENYDQNNMNEPGNEQSYRPLNLYFPDAWMEQASRDFEYALVTKSVSSAFAGYCFGLSMLDSDAYMWAYQLAYINAGMSILAGPTWMYTYPSKPRSTPAPELLAKRLAAVEALRGIWASLPEGWDQEE